MGVGEDLPNAPVIRVVEALAAAGLSVICVSGRSEATRRETSVWLALATPLRPVGLYLRRNGDARDDTEVKAEMLQEIQADGWNIVCVFDDRDRTVEMWRRHGLTCLQVAPGAF